MIVYNYPFYFEIENKSIVKALNTYFQSQNKNDNLGIDNKYTPSSFGKVSDSDINNKISPIDNPDYNQIHIHYVDKNGKDISGLQDKIIDLTETGTRNYNIPDWYTIANNKGYSSTAKNIPITLPVTSAKVTGGVYGYYGGTRIPEFRDLVQYATDPHNIADAYNQLDGNGNKIQVYIHVSSASGDYEDYYTKVFHINLKTGNRLTTIDNTPISVQGQFYISKDANKLNSQDNLTKILYWIAECDGGGYDNADAQTRYKYPAYIEPAQYGSVTYEFIDNSNQIKSVNGNTINLVVSKLQDKQKLAIDFIDTDTQNKCNFLRMSKINTFLC